MSNPFYITQESAFAPGIVRDWPEVIPLPKNKNGRLVKSKTSLKALLEMTIVLAWESDDDASIGDLVDKILSKV